MSNCVFNFNILALVVSEILGGSQIYVRGPCAPSTPPSVNFFCTPGEYVSMSNGIFNFNFLALVLSEILGGPKFTLGGPTPPGRPLAEKFFYPKRQSVRRFELGTGSRKKNSITQKVTRVLYFPYFGGSPAGPIRP